VHSGWQQVATTDTARIDSLWRQYPQANIYSPTGRQFDVLDVDHHVLNEWQRITGYELPETWRWRTGSGNWQLGFQAVPGLGNAVKKISHADTRAKGGLCILPPSRNRNGIYEWVAVPWDTVLAAWPADLLAALRTPPRPAPSMASRPDGLVAHIPASLIRWAEQGAVVGERNGRAFWLSCRLRQCGAEDAEALGILARLAAACTPPLSMDEVERIWRSSARHQGYDPMRQLPVPTRPPARRLLTPSRPPARRIAVPA
jgi:hypothetical protein